MIPAQRSHRDVVRGQQEHTPGLDVQPASGSPSRPSPAPAGGAVCPSFPHSQATACSSYWVTAAVTVGVSMTWCDAATPRSPGTGEVPAACGTRPCGNSGFRLVRAPRSRPGERRALRAASPGAPSRSARRPWAAARSCRAGRPPRAASRSCPSSATPAAPAGPAVPPGLRPGQTARSYAPPGPRSARPAPRPGQPGHHRAARSQPEILPTAAATLPVNGRACRAET